MTCCFFCTRFCATTCTACRPAALPLGAAAAEDPAARQAWFGDLHLHTGFSVDAFTLGGTTVTPASENLHYCCVPSCRELNLLVEG